MVIGNNEIHEKINNDRWKQIYFDVILSDRDIRLTFSINIEDCVVVMKKCKKVKWEKTSMKDRSVFIEGNKDIFECFNGNVFHPYIHFDAFSDRYFDELLWNEFPGVIEKLYKYWFGDINGFMRELYLYCFDKKIEMIFDNFKKSNIIRGKKVTLEDLNRMGIYK